MGFHRVRVIVRAPSLTGTNAADEQLVNERNCMGYARVRAVSQLVDVCSWISTPYYRYPLTAVRLALHPIPEIHVRVLISAAVSFS